jgi:hypothetical protein
MAKQRVEEGSNWLGGNRTREVLAASVGLLGGWLLGCAGGAITDRVIDPAEANRLATITEEHYRTSEGYIETITVTEGEESLLPFGMDVSTFIGGLVGSAAGFGIGRSIGKDPNLLKEIQESTLRIAKPGGIIRR